MKELTSWIEKVKQVGGSMSRPGTADTQPSTPSKSAKSTDAASANHADAKDEQPTKANMKPEVKNVVTREPSTTVPLPANAPEQLTRTAEPPLSSPNMPPRPTPSSTAEIVVDPSTPRKSAVEDPKLSTPRSAASHDPGVVSLPKDDETEYDDDFDQDETDEAKKARRKSVQPAS